MKKIFQEIKSAKVEFLFIELELISLKKELISIETTLQNLVWKKQLADRLLQAEEKLKANKGFLTWVEYVTKNNKAGPGLTPTKIKT